MDIKIKQTIAILLAVLFLLTVTVGAVSASHPVLKKPENMITSEKKVQTAPNSEIIHKNNIMVTFKKAKISIER